MTGAQHGPIDRGSLHSLKPSESRADSSRSIATIRPVCSGCMTTSCPPCVAVSCSSDAGCSRNTPATRAPYRSGAPLSDTTLIKRRLPIGRPSNRSSHVLLAQAPDDSADAFRTGSTDDPIPAPPRVDIMPARPRGQRSCQVTALRNCSNKLERRIAHSSAIGDSTKPEKLRHDRTTAGQTTVSGRRTSQLPGHRRRSLMHARVAASRHREREPIVAPKLGTDRRTAIEPTIPRHPYQRLS